MAATARVTFPSDPTDGPGLSERPARLFCLASCPAELKTPVPMLLGAGDRPQSSVPIVDCNKANGIVLACDSPLPENHKSESSPKVSECESSYFDGRLGRSWLERCSQGAALWRCLTFRGEVGAGSSKGLSRLSSRSFLL